MINKTDLQTRENGLRKLTRPVLRTAAARHELKFDKYTKRNELIIMILKVEFPFG